MTVCSLACDPCRRWGRPGEPEIPISTKYVRCLRYGLLWSVQPIPETALPYPTNETCGQVHGTALRVCAGEFGPSLRRPCHREKTLANLRAHAWHGTQGFY
jgi:hypothetical protein